MLIHALVTSRLDYYNVIYVGIPLKTMWKLQLVQNTAACTILPTPWFTYVTPLLCDLHWLPIVFKVQFKLMVIIF